jgi:hypothetical protein
MVVFFLEILIIGASGSLKIWILFKGKFLKKKKKLNISQANPIMTHIILQLSMQKIPTLET